jgi:hypothetical protein
MAWYDIPQFKVEYIHKNDEPIAIQMDMKDFEKLIEKMEDLLDNLAVEQSKKEKKAQFYTHGEIKELIASKKQ